MEVETSNNETVTDAESRYLSPTDDDTASQPPKVTRHTQRWIMVLTVVLSLTGIVIATTLRFTKDAAEHPRAKLERLQELQTTLLNFSDPLAFVRPDSPPSQALQYLAYKQDHFDLRSKDRVAQLYALLVLLFACGGDTDLLDDSTVSECKVPHLKCDEAGNLIGADFRNQKLSGELPRELGLLTHLKRLDLRDNDIEGTIPSSTLGSLTNLERLWLDSNKFISTISPALGELSNLRTLGLAGNLLTGTVPTTLSKLTRMEEFLLANNRLSGEIFPIALDWQNLTHFDIASSDLGGTIPSGIGALSNIVFFDVRFSNVFGSIPTEITKLTQLRKLNIDGPLFEGTLPDSIGSMTELESISFTGRKLWGTIPSSIGLLSNLRYVRIGDSQVSGQIPTELANCWQMHKMSFEISQISGTLPAEFATLGGLESIFLESTKITFIPEEVCGTGVRIITDCELRCSCCDSESNCS